MPLCCSTLKGILASAQETRHKKWYKKAWFVNQDAQFLQSIRQKIVEATNDFEVRDILVHVVSVSDLECS